jgi:hypothetical protein
MEDESLSNGIGNGSDDPRMNQVITTFPSSAIQIVFIRNRQSAINEGEFVLRPKCSTQRTTPSKIIGTVELRSNGEGARTFTRMHIKD